MTRASRAIAAALCVLVWSAALQAGDTSSAGVVAGNLPVISTAPVESRSLAPVSEQNGPEHNGLEIYRRFRSGLADPSCDDAATSTRWKKHFSHAPGQLARVDDDLLPLFGYVVDALREAQLPTEFALIPFVESGYKPGARSASGPAGLWQFIGVTARNHGIAIGDGYDGRLSPVDSTQAAVRYLKTLHGMFGGDWRLAVMAYNAGEYRILQSMRRAGMNAQNAQPENLPGLSGITYAYVEKLHALACVLEQADEGGQWLERLDRPVPQLAAHTLPADAGSLDAWARRAGHDSKQLRRLNPALAARLPASSKPLRVLAPSRSGLLAWDTSSSVATAPTASLGPIGAADAPGPLRVVAPQSHTVRRGESAWTIARLHGLKPAQLLTRNRLAANAILRPGMVLQLGEQKD